MKIQKLMLLAVTLSLGACASMIQIASISEAYKMYGREEYDRTLELITRAENTDETTAEMKAELTYLKAQTYEGLGNSEVATILYEYLAEQHRNSQYGYLAVKKLNSSL